MTGRGSLAARSQAPMQDDRILAATHAAGAWVDVRVLHLGEVVAFLRGKLRTSFALQVQSANQKTSLTVTLNRTLLLRSVP